MSYCFEKYFRPSVLKYCEKYNYDYELITEPILNLPLEKGEKGANERMQLFSRYDKYDFIMHLDIDIFVTEKAPALVPAEFAAVLEKKNKLNKRYNIPDYTNGGMYYFSSKTAQILWEETQRLQKGEFKEWHKVLHGNQTIVNYWVQKNKIPKTILNRRWNTMKGVSPWEKRWEESFFIHYAGHGVGQGKDSFSKDFSVPLNLKVFLKVKNIRYFFKVIKRIIKNKLPKPIRQFFKYSSIGSLRRSSFLETRYMLLNKFSKNYGIRREKRRVPLIVSLTSFPERIKKVYLAIETILRQTEKPDYIYLCLAKEEFPNQRKDLPKKLLDLEKRGLTIKFYDKNLKSYNKLIHTLKENPKANIIIIDDDNFYPNTLIENLYKLHKKSPKEIICLRGKKVLLDGKNQLSSYDDFKFFLKEEESFFVFPRGVGGVLYPPNSLHQEIFNEEVFLDICPIADDIWFYAMALLNNTKSKSDVTWKKDYPLISKTQKIALWRTNVSQGLNDIQMKKVFDKYHLYQKLK